MSEYALEMRQVCKRYGATIALDAVNFKVKPGEVRALIGHNGAGKSTLMNLLSGSQQLDSGQMLLNGKAYSPADVLAARHAGVVMINQELTAIAHQSVAENLFLGRELTRGWFLDRAEMRRRAQILLQELGHDINVDTLMGELSISQQQVIEIAGTRVSETSVVVFDEPTSSLTAADVVRLFELIKFMKSRGHAIVYISQRLKEICEIADSFTVMRDGKVAGEGQVSGNSVDQLIELMLGAPVQNLYGRNRHAPRTDAVVLEIDGLSSHFRLESASLTLRKGEILGIFGLMGSGRTELLRAIFGLDQRRSGSIKLNGVLLEASTTPAQLLRQGMGMLSEDRKSEGLALSMSIGENIILPMAASNWTPGTSRRQQASLCAHAAIRELGIRCQGPEQPVCELSGGNQQKVAFASLLAMNPEVLLLDEPTRGIDIGSQQQIYQLIDREAGKGKAILLVTSDLPELLGVCDRVAVMHRGRLSVVRPVAEVDEAAVMLEATGVKGEQK